MGAAKKVEVAEVAESSLLLVEATVVVARLALVAVLVLLGAYSQPAVTIFAQATSLLVHVIPVKEKAVCVDPTSDNML